MLSGLAEYIFGNSAGGEVEPASAEGVGSGTRPSASMQITYTEDDWVLVDVTNSPKRARESHQSDNQHNIQPQGIPVPHQLEESWLVTPPPCFTAGGNVPQELATSPMENLLIEHPSMSVYGPRSNSMVIRARRTNQHEAGTSQVAKRPKPRNLRVRNAEPPRRAEAVAARLGLENPPNLAAIQEAEAMQRQKRGSLSRSKVERHNKAYHQQNRSGKRHYRQNMSGRHSRVTYKQC
ncbi:tumor protein p53-inducible nuclear protein 2-like [Acanthaster planci]|uniref:Tumor protein p53-inducible nuclear protein 2-like n=1 Tax=Acanthaster planci TaxID=133434 RepID=A0A8B7YHM4_ACAPL|nr:tumor protein p53-inducible nuclear protein 2-like [Acanthaster planci]